MGNVNSSNCVNLKKLHPDIWAEIQAEHFTVERNLKYSDDSNTGYIAAKQEDGWRIQFTPHSNICGGSYVAGIGPTGDKGQGDSVATNQIYGRDDKLYWRIFMNNGLCEKNHFHGADCHVHACGWHVCDPARRTFWPTRCVTPMEKEAWWRWFDQQLESLSAAN